MSTKQRYSIVIPDNFKVALFIPTFAGGGAERVMISLANELTKYVSNVDLVIVNDSDMSIAAQLIPNVNLVNLNRRRAMLSILPFRQYLIHAKPNAVLTTLHHVSASATIAMAITNNLPTKLYIREDLAPSPIPSTKPFYYILRQIIKWAYNRADGIISLSDDMAEEIRKHLSTKGNIHTIYNPVDIDDILASAELPMTPTPPWDPKERYVLGIGRLEKQKNFETLIHAFALHRKRHNTKLIILGEGSERRSLERLIKQLDLADSVYMPGFVDNPFPFMKLAYKFVLSSKREGLPNALVQAIICGTQCISTDCPTGPREILDNGNLGTLVEIGDYAAIAHELNRSSLHRSTIELPKLRQKYDIQRVTLKYLDVLSGSKNLGSR